MGLLPASEAMPVIAIWEVGDLCLGSPRATCTSVLTFDCVGVWGPGPKRDILKPDSISMSFTQEN